MGWELTCVFIDGAGNTPECSFTVTVTEGECHNVYYKGVSKVWARPRVLYI